jgi:hypothetical protein
VRRRSSLYQRALAIREKTLGPDHPETADSLTAWRCFIATMAF